MPPSTAYRARAERLTRSRRRGHALGQSAAFGAYRHASQGTSHGGIPSARTICVAQHSTVGVFCRCGPPLRRAGIAETRTTTNPRPDTAPESDPADPPAPSRRPRPRSRTTGPAPPPLRHPSPSSARPPQLTGHRARSTRPGSRQPPGDHTTHVDRLANRASVHGTSPA
jgi:hypothetical protein